jgi:hypothetical protein
VQKAKALALGDPFDEKVPVGPIINERQAANVGHSGPIASVTSPRRRSPI